MILEELDYVNEAANIERFAANFADEPQVVVPGVHHDLSRGRVLVMDWIEGENLARALATGDQDTADAATRILVDAYLKQILVDGFLHADPHPGQLPCCRDRRRMLSGSSTSALARRSVRADAARHVRPLRGGHDRRCAGAAAAALDRLGFPDPLGRRRLARGLGEPVRLRRGRGAREANWAKLTAAAREDPLVKLPDELIMVGRVLMVQTGLVGRIKPRWSMEELVKKRLSEARSL